MVQLDTRIEKQVEDLVKMLSGLRDSQESRTKVTQLKKSAIEGLKRGIELYAKKRKEIREMVRTGGDEALVDLGKIDQRILKRVDQIAELTKSIPTHDDVEKYQSDGGHPTGMVITTRTAVSVMNGNRTAATPTSPTSSARTPPRP